MRIGQAAALLGVSCDLLRQWDRDRVLPARRTLAGHRRYVREELEEFMRRKTDVPPRALGPDAAKGLRLSQGPVPPAVPTKPAYQSEPTPCCIWDAEIGEARSDVEILKAQRESEALRRAILGDQKEAQARAEEERLQIESEKRLSRLKSCGRAMARDLPAYWQARVVADLEDFVTARQFPAGLGEEDAHRYLQARVERWWERYRTTVRQQAEEARRRQQVENLISMGKTTAILRTFGWQPEVADRARRAVLRELQAQVRWDWTESDVRDCVDEVVDQWGVADEDNDEDGLDDDGDEGCGDEYEADDDD